MLFFESQGRAQDTQHTATAHRTRLLLERLEERILLSGGTAKDGDPDLTEGYSSQAAGIDNVGQPGEPENGPVTEASNYVFASEDGAALEGSVSGSEGSPAISAVAPLPSEGESITAVINRLEVEFTESMTAEGMNDPASWELRSAGIDETFDTTDDELYALSTDPEYVSGETVTLELGVQALQVGQYRFTAFAGSLNDLEGNPLDGDGDGTGGDDYLHTFQVSVPPGTVIESTSNGSLAAATALPLGEDPAGGGYFVGRGLGSIRPSTDEDWWSFEALAGDVVSVSVDTPGSGLSPD
jgi:hypothetical protein